MVLDIINTLIENYKKLIVRPDYDEIYKWESLKIFQDRWNIDEPDFYTMYDESLQNSDSNNLWASKFFYPKEVMLQFIKSDTEKVRQMFRDLFNEDESIDSRIDKFVYNCDTLRDILQEDNEKFQHHFHDGFRIISVYLNFRFPMKYTIYKYTEFKEFMDVVRAKTIPGTNEIDRFFKVMRTLHGILVKDIELIQIHKNICNDSKYYQNNTLLLAQDFYWCVSRQNLYKKN